ncbi:hypothetical protein SLEP1_g41334 [Rubroshorea leprosula]|uniref:Uncharacterized protein n=1 Tax=Rubroshorea leprosula TaxID=152421 RepID=A0AAV5L6B4_9ROSI|nr:hypothetical protein SLEP1_g41334 [Rubroshorea leprosula]
MGKADFSSRLTKGFTCCLPIHWAPLPLYRFCPSSLEVFIVLPVISTVINEKVTASVGLVTKKSLPFKLFTDLFYGFQHHLEASYTVPRLFMPCFLPIPQPNVSSLLFTATSKIYLVPRIFLQEFDAMGWGGTASCGDRKSKGEQGRGNR